MLFREYNELPHIFNERISKSYKYAKKYEQKFSTHMTNAIMEKIIFFFGTCLTLLLGLTFYNENLVLYIKLFDRNLLWYLAVLTTIVTIARSTMINSTSVDESTEEIMKKITQGTHYFPDNWENNSHKYSVLTEFQTLFKLKITNIFFEIISMFVIPYYIFTEISTNLNKIADFIKENTKYCEEIGYICTGGLNEGLNIYSSIDNEFGNIHELLIEDKKIQRSIDNFNNYYHKNIKINYKSLNTIDDDDQLL
jgi:autophagy-related protein 9